MWLPHYMNRNEIYCVYIRIHYILIRLYYSYGLQWIDICVHIPLCLYICCPLITLFSCNYSSIVSQFILQFSGRSDCCEGTEVRLIPRTINYVYVDLHCATCQLQRAWPTMNYLGNPSPYLIHLLGGSPQSRTITRMPYILQGTLQNVCQHLYGISMHLQCVPV